MTLPSLSIVIPTFNGRDHLERCLPSVHRHAPPATQVIVVDDASSDGTTAWLRRSHPWVQMLSLSSNQGFCRAVNAGIAKARGEVVELLNNDTEVCLGWAEKALSHFADPQVGSVAPLVLFMDQPDVIDSAGQEYHVCGWGRNRGYGRKLSPEYENPCDVLGPSGSSGFYRRGALERAGGLLPEYGAYFEDIDLSFRLRWSGYRCIHEPASRVLHKGSATYGRQPEQMVRLLARNEELVYWLNLQSHQLLLGLSSHLGFLAVRALRRSLAGQGAAFFKGKLEAVRLWRWILQRRRELRKLIQAKDAPVLLKVSSTPQVLRQGWAWLNRRQSA